jgi:ABC-type xylose transport system substrate-binding protein
MNIGSEMKVQRVCWKQKEKEKESEVQVLKEKYEQDIKSMREEMSQQFSQIMLMIQQNPKLAQIKPDALTNKKLEQKR